MAGGTIIAGELWVPGQKLISIPSGKQFYGPSIFELVDDKTVRYIGNQDKVVSVQEFYNWMMKHADHMLKRHGGMDEMFVTLEHGYRIDNPEHLHSGSLCQDAAHTHGLSEQRETWVSASDMASDDLVTDKIYHGGMDSPRFRISELDNGHRGYR